MFPIKMCYHDLLKPWKNWLTSQVGPQGEQALCKGGLSA
jgi:hypothetical protein